MSNKTETGSLSLDGDALKKLAELLSGLRYGSLEVTVHDGRITQVERRERVRLN